MSEITEARGQLRQYLKEHPPQEKDENGFPPKAGLPYRQEEWIAISTQHLVAWLGRDGISQALPPAGAEIIYAAGDALPAGTITSWWHDEPRQQKTFNYHKLRMEELEEPEQARTPATGDPSPNLLK